MTIYFDMDGVLADLYRVMAEAWGVSQENLHHHGEETARRYKAWILEPPGPEEIFASVPPIHLESTRSLMLELVGRGHQIAVLSSLGVDPEFDVSEPVRAGKERWLRTHYGDFLSQGLLSEVHLVENSHIKRKFSKNNALLIDDALHLVEAFIEEGGLGVHYNSEQHAECAAQILRITGKVGA